MVCKFMRNSPANLILPSKPTHRPMNPALVIASKIRCLNAIFEIVTMSELGTARFVKIDRIFMHDLTSRRRKGFVI